MSVIVKQGNQHDVEVFVKGSPESIKEVCISSTSKKCIIQFFYVVPRNYHECLNDYAKQGYRVIACASKILRECTWIQAQKLTREMVESELIFLGFIIFENRLKPQSAAVLKSLHSASIKCVMATGNLYIMESLLFLR